MIKIRFFLFLIFSHAMLSSAQDCPSWIAKKLQLLGAEKQCVQIQNKNPLALKSYVLVGEADGKNPYKLAGVSIVLVETSQDQEELHIVDKITGMGESQLEFEYEKSNTKFHSMTVNKKDLFLFRSKSDRVAPFFVIELLNKKLKTLSIKEDNGLIRKALIGRSDKNPSVFNTKKHPLLIRLPISYGRGAKTYTLKGSYLLPI